MATRTRESKAGKGGAPSAVHVRMYNVGFGDCLLLTFDYAAGPRHMLIDFGTSAAPQGLGKDYMTQVAKDIEKQCHGKLDILVVTHRHLDHISGFSTDGAATGKIIANLKPACVIQPWTEDPRAQTDAKRATARSYTGGKPDQQSLTAHYLGALEDMHIVADTALRLAGSGTLAVGTASQMSFLGETNLKNLSAVKNLMEMGRRGKALYVNAEMELNDLLPGVGMRVLGPPTLEQSDAIRKERSKDPNEFWTFRSFWGFQAAAATHMAAGKPTLLFPDTPRVPDSRQPPDDRWFIHQARRIRGDQLLELVRDLDSAMNNTSVILLMEVNGRTLLFPGDAQIENWAFALNHKPWQAPLSAADLYKVGHHGSLNATPKSLWGLFAKKGDEKKKGRLKTICSTKFGKHGSVKAGTEVPRSVLVKELRKDSAFLSTEEYPKKELLVQEVTILTN
jgi:beta-lactamase superfamily II metal-dependent hydrolase